MPLLKYKTMVSSALLLLVWIASSLLNKAIHILHLLCLCCQCQSYAITAKAIFVAVVMMQHNSSHFQIFESCNLLQQNVAIWISTENQRHFTCSVALPLETSLALTGWFWSIVIYFWSIVSYCQDLIYVRHTRRRPEKMCLQGTYSISVHMALTFHCVTFLNEKKTSSQLKGSELN